jgi:hypothetical protein
MIDRHARDQMEALISAYMAGTLRSDELDEAKSKIEEATIDDTVKQVGFSLWFFYDDLIDHTIVADKDTWDYLNRLRLLLQSDGEIESIGKGRRWQWPQRIATLALLGFGMVVAQVGFGEHLLVYALPFGVISMVLSWFNRRRERVTALRGMRLTPFPSVRSLLAVRRQVAGFTRIHYPRMLAGKRIRSRLAGWFMLLPSYLMWLMFSPLVLACQALPERESEIQIKLSETPMTQTTTTT